VAICTGKGDTDGGHCCWINGEVCGFLFIDRGGTPRCGLWGEWGDLASNVEWVKAPIGRWFAENHPGYDCSDWPQNIPEAMALPGRCCWNTEVEVSLGDLG